MDEKKWIASIFDSIKGIERATPKSDLLATIVDRVVTPGTKVVSIRQWRVAAAAAAVLIGINIYGVLHYRQDDTAEQTEVIAEIYSAESLAFDYQFYEL